jgi:hypothetical protein
VNNKKKIVRPRPTVRDHEVHLRGQIRAIQLGEHLPDLPHLAAEIYDMTDVLLGRVDPPYDHGVMTLMETADAFFARASEIHMLLQKGEREGTISKGSAHYKFRTGELRTFLEMAKRAADLGSRRLTDEQLRFEQSKLGRDSA